MKKATKKWFFAAILTVFLGYVPLSGAIDLDIEEKIEKANDDISQTLEKVLSHVNNAGKVQQEDLDYLKQVLKENVLYVLKMEPENQAKYYLLSSWTNFYSGAHERALKESLKAFKLSPENADIRATVISLAIATQRTASLGPIRLYMKKNPDEDSSGTLNFSMDMLNLELLGKPMASGVFTCLNDEKLELKEDILYAGMMWKLRYQPKKEEKNGREALFAESSRDKENEEFSADKVEAFENFSGLCVDNAGNEKVAFFSLNCDKDFDIKNLYKFIVANSGPWAQVVLGDEGNGFARLLMNVELEQARIMMVYEGKIVYFGSWDTFLPQLVISTITETELESYQPSDINPENRKTEMGDFGDFSKKTSPEEPQRDTEIDQTAPKVTQREPEKTDKTGELIDSMQAQRLLEIAKMDFQRMGLTTYKKGVDACREILSDYPKSKQAVQAREMLRGLPDRIKKRFDITDQELGYN